jgi:hypothetical protein
MTAPPIIAFHAHLEECGQCAGHPFDLCSVGAGLLAACESTQYQSRLRAEVVRLRNQLKLAAIRLGILADRMDGCNAQAEEEGRAPTHELLDEARDFERLARAAAGLEKR